MTASRYAGRVSPGPKLPTDLALADLVATLDGYLPPPAPGLPGPTLSVASVEGGPVGLGDRRGSRTVGEFGATELKGLRLDAVVHCQLWSTDPARSDGDAGELTARLLADRDALRNRGVLRLRLSGMAPAEQPPGTDGWRRLIDYRVLYEYQYEDSDGALGLIARIPVAVDREEPDSPDRETTTVTNRAARWDTGQAPALVTRGAGVVGGLSALVFAAGPEPVAPVRLARGYDGAPAPTPYGSLAAFLDHVAGPDAPERNGCVDFASFHEFLASFSAAGGPGPGGVSGSIRLGDPPVEYRPLVLRFDPPVCLPTAHDHLTIGYGAAAFDAVAVCYLSAAGLSPAAWPSPGPD